MEEVCSNRKVHFGIPMRSRLIYIVSPCCVFPPGLPLAPFYPGNLQAHAATTVCAGRTARARSASVPAAASNNHKKHINLPTAGGQTRTGQHVDIAIAISLSLSPCAACLSPCCFIISLTRLIFPPSSSQCTWISCSCAVPYPSKYYTKIIFCNTSQDK